MQVELDNVYIQLLEQNRELPDREVVLARFREAFFQRLQRGSARAEASAYAEEDEASSFEPEIEEWAAEAAEVPEEDGAPTPFSLDDEPASQEADGEQPDLLGDLGFGDQPPEEDELN
jgi:hypothetical protein